VFLSQLAIRAQYIYSLTVGFGHNNSECEIAVLIEYNMIKKDSKIMTRIVLTSVTQKQTKRHKHIQEQ